jgi:transposase
LQSNAIVSSKFSFTFAKPNPHDFVKRTVETSFECWLRSIDRFADLSDVQRHVAPFYSCIGLPSIDPELLVWMLLVEYCYGIRSERRLCEEVHLKLAYRWFCRLGLDGEVARRTGFYWPRPATWV